MDKDPRRELLKQLLTGKITPEEALPLLKTGYPEMVVVWGKSDGTYQVAETKEVYTTEPELRAAMLPRVPAIVKIIPSTKPIFTSEKEAEEWLYK